MKERDERHYGPLEPEPYWQGDVALGDGHFYDEPYTIRLRPHTATHVSADEIMALPRL